MRKPIQIAIEPEGETNHSALYALCDDGMIFVTTFDPQRGWNEWGTVKPIPQDEPAE